jgi:trimeric autotransporter adhesin
MKQVQQTGMMKLVLVALALGTSPLCATAQNNYNIGTGTTSNLDWTYPSPFGDYYESTRQQFLYTAAEAKAAGMNAGNITGIKWTVTALNGAGVHEQFTIKIGSTSAGSLTPTGWETGTSVVYGPGNYQPVAGANTFTFATPFTWDGTSNIVVEVCTGSSSNVSSDHYSENASVAYTSVPFNGSRTMSYDDWGNICSTNDTFRYHQIAGNRPNITFIGAGIAPCQAPSAINTSAITSSSVGLSWPAVSGASGYEYAVTTSATAPASGTPVSGASVSKSGLNKGTKYYVYVRSKCGSTYSSWATKSFNTLMAAGLEQVEGELSIVSISPNPAGSFVNIYTEEPGRLNIVDLKGSLVKELQIAAKETKLDVSGLGSGFYFVRFNNGHWVQTLKFQKH